MLTCRMTGIRPISVAWASGELELEVVFIVIIIIIIISLFIDKTHVMTAHVYNTN